MMSAGERRGRPGPGTGKGTKASPETLGRPKPIPRYPAVQVPAARPGVSVEAALYAVILLIALAARLIHLDEWPLTTMESRHALAAWQAMQGLPHDMVGLSPLLVYGTVLPFLVFGAGDATARLLPALLGASLAVLPWFLRYHLGRSGALAAAVILALSPSFLYFSRTLDGGIVVAAGGLWLLACGLRYAAQGGAYWLYGAAISLALLLLGDGSAWATAMILGLGLAAAAWRSDKWHLLEGIRRHSGQALALLGSLLLLASTGLFTNLSGIQQGLLDPLFSWIGGFVSADRPMPWHYYLTALLVYEPVVVAFSLTALALWAAHHDALGRFPLVRWRVTPAAERTTGQQASVQRTDAPTVWWSPFLMGWMILSLGWLTLYAAKPPSYILHALAPAALLAGWGIGRVLEGVSREMVLGRGGLALVWVLFLIVFAVAAIVNPTPLFGGRFATLERQLQIVNMALVGVVLLILVALAASLARHLGAKGAALAMALWALVVLSAFSIHQAWALSFFPNSGEMLAPIATSPEVRLLVQDLAARSRFIGETNIEIAMEPGLRYPLAWYLREYRRLTFSDVSAPPKTPVVIVSQARDKAAQAYLDGYRGQRYRLRTDWNLAVTPGASLWRWLANRIPLAPAVGEDIMVYLKR